MFFRFITYYNKSSKKNLQTNNSHAHFYLLSISLHHRRVGRHASGINALIVITGAHTCTILKYFFSKDHLLRPQLLRYYRKLSSSNNSHFFPVARASICIINPGRCRCKQVSETIPRLVSNSFRALIIKF